MTALSCSLGSWHQPRTGAGAAGGRTRTVLVSVASRLVSPWSVLAVLLGSPGLQISRLPVLCLAGVAKSFLSFLPLPA